MYWDGSCSGLCESPLTRRFEGGYKYCENDCLTFLHYDGTCQASCNLPYATNTAKSRSYCYYPCLSYQWLYADGTCDDYCNYPLLKITNPDDQCVDPCGSTALYYYDIDAHCSIFCEYPYDAIVTTKSRLCRAPWIHLSNDEQQDVENLKKHYEGISTAFNWMVIAQAFLVPSDPSTIATVMLFKSLYYVRFIEMEFPEKTLLFFKRQQSNTVDLNFGFDSPQGIRQDFTVYTIPFLYFDFGMHSSFIINFFKAITTLILLICYSGILKFVYGVAKRYKWSPSWMEAIESMRFAAKYNIFYLFFYSNFDEIIQFTSL